MKSKEAAGAEESRESIAGGVVAGGIVAAGQLQSPPPSMGGSIVEELTEYLAASSLGRHNAAPRPAL